MTVATAHTYQTRKRQLKNERKCATLLWMLFKQDPQNTPYTHEKTDKSHQAVVGVKTDSKKEKLTEETIQIDRNSKYFFRYAKKFSTRVGDSKWPRAGLLKNVAPSIVVFATVQRIDYAQIRATVKQPYTKNQHGKFP